MRLPLDPKLALIVVATGIAVAACGSTTRNFGNSGGAGGTGDASSSASKSSSSPASASSAMVMCTKASDCMSLDDTCNAGACVNGMCEKMPANENAACDDGKFCTSNDACQAGVCTGTATACKGMDSCHVATCDAATDMCVESVGNDGASCDDMKPCTAGTTCSAGVCVGGTPTDCSGLSGPCSIGVCDVTKGCVATAANEGGACDDGLYCTVGDFCQAGKCTGAPNDCGIVSPCLAPQCDEASQTCVGVAANNGAACNDNNSCTLNDVCSNGGCSGSPVGCISFDGCCSPGCGPINDADCGPLNQPTYNASFTFQDALPSTTMTLTWDGTHYWSVSGGGPSGDREAEYTAAGALVATFQPNIDFRAIFTRGGNGATVYERTISATLLKTQTAPGVFGSNFTTLVGGTLDAQANVVYTAGGEIVSMVGGSVSRWTSGGAFIATFALKNFSAAENMYPQNRGIAVASGYYLTYYNQILSAWDGAGNRIASATLSGAGTTFDSYFSLSYANGMVFICDVAMGTWRGYAVGL